MKGITKLSAVALATMMLSGCNWFDGDDDTSAPPPEPEVGSTFVRVHHTSSDAPNVNVNVNGTATLENVAYQQSSAVLELDEGTYEVSVDGILPGDELVTVIGPVDLALAADTRYEVFAVGNVADDTLDALVVENPVTAIADGNIRAQVVHAASAAPAVDIYVTAPEAVLADEQAVATLAFGEFSGQLDVPAGDYQIRVTLAGDVDTVVYDTGTLTLAAGSDLVIAAVNNTAAGAAPIALQVANGTDAAIVYDQNTGSDIRVVHAAADAPAVDVFLNNGAEPAIADLAFGEFAGYVEIPAGEYLVDVAAANGGPTVLDDLPLATAAGAQYSVYAVGALADESLTLAVLGEDSRSIATEARLQVVHASPSAGDVDVYLTATDDITDATPALTEVPFDSTALANAVVGVAPGDYFISVAVAGTKTVAIGPLAVSLDAGGVYTVVAVDGAPASGEAFGVILLDDFVAAE